MVQKKMKTRVLLLALLLTLVLQPVHAAKPQLKFRADGVFKVVMFSDVQDGPILNPKATELMERILDAEKPDMVVIAGDCIAGYSCKSADEVKQAIACVAYPMETRKIPWAITFGNHDQEHFPKSNLNKDAVIKIYQGYPNNLNVRGDKKIHGAGNDDLLIKGKDGKPAFCIWLIDSNEYAPKAIGGYDWIHTDQLAWYCQTSKNLETKYGQKIPGIMFFHIPLPEFMEMHTAGKTVGDRRETEGAAKVNSGLFAAVLDRGDVTGIFCGHAHVNNYVGEWMGVRLGFDAAIGYASYNVPEKDPTVGTGHGGRIFEIKESDPWHWNTWMRFVDGTTR